MEQFNQKLFAVMELHFNTIWSTKVKQLWDLMEQAFCHQSNEKLFRRLIVAKRLISGEP